MIIPNKTVVMVCQICRMDVVHLEASHEIRMVGVGPYFG